MFMPIQATDSNRQKEYAEILGLKFACATNGHCIVEHDYLTGQDNDLDTFLTADDL
jgi:type I restriction enzyme, R subunit